MYKRIRQCIGKNKYPDSDEAKREMHRLKTTGAIGDLNVYLCEYCGYYHIGGLQKRYKSVPELVVDGTVYVKKSMQRTHDDAYAYKALLERKGHQVIIKPPNTRRKQWHVYVRKIQI